MTIDDYNGIPLEQTSETNYNYNVGGEIKKTVPFTKELREWLLSFKAIGMRVVDTLYEVRQFTKYKPKQIIACIENRSVYQFRNVSGTDDGLDLVKPFNVNVINTGRWVKILEFSDATFNLWQAMKYQGEYVVGQGDLPISDDDTIFYINNSTGQDIDEADGTAVLPFKTVEYAIDRFGNRLGYWKAKLTLVFQSNYTEQIKLFNYKQCHLEINSGNYVISDIIIMGNGGLIKLIGQGSILKLVTKKNNDIEIDGYEFPALGEYQVYFENRIGMYNLIFRTDVGIQDVDTLKCSEISIDFGKYLELLRCKANLSAIDGDVFAYNSVVTRQLSPSVTGTRSLIGDN